MTKNLLGTIKSLQQEEMPSGTKNGKVNETFPESCPVYAGYLTDTFSGPHDVPFGRCYSFPS